MKRVKKITVNMNILPGVSNLELKALEFMDSLRPPGSGFKILVVSKNPQTLVQMGLTSSFDDVEIITNLDLRQRLIRKEPVVHSILCLNFDVGELKHLSDIISIGSLFKRDIEAFFGKTDKTITEVISMYTFLMKKANINFYSIEHFKDLHTGGKWRFIPGMNSIRR